MNEPTVEVLDVDEEEKKERRMSERIVNKKRQRVLKEKDKTMEVNRKLFEDLKALSKMVSTDSENPPVHKTQTVLTTEEDQDPILHSVADE